MNNTTLPPTERPTSSFEPPAANKTNPATTSSVPVVSTTAVSWPWIRIVTGLSIGIFLAAIVNSQIYPYWLSPDARLARSQGLPVRAYVDVMSILHAGEKRPLTSPEIDKLAETVNNSNNEIRFICLVALTDPKAPADNARALAIARDKISDKDPLVRAGALTLMHKLDAPETLEVAQACKANDVSDLVRQRAQLVVDKRTAHLSADSKAVGKERR